MKSNIITDKKYIILFLIIFIIFGIYIIYLNLNIYNLKENINNKNELYKIQIKNRIKEIDLLNEQLTDLQQILNIGLDLSNNGNIYLNTKINDFDKKYLLKSIPSGSPLKKTFITSEYGYRKHPVLKKMKFHTGVDFKAAIGTEVYAPADGIVVKSRKFDPGGYGKMIIISHNFAFKTLFGHLSDVLVNEGDVIKKGSLIGLTGNSGQTSGPHLHYEIRFIEKDIEPINFVYWNNKTFNTIFTKKIKLDWEKLILLIKIRISERKIL